MKRREVIRPNIPEPARRKDICPCGRIKRYKNCCGKYVDRETQPKDIKNKGIRGKH